MNASEEQKMDQREMPDITTAGETHYVYILRCGDDTLYTGWTTDLTMRIKTHNEGHGAKYTRSRLPVVLIYHERFSNKSDALKREHAIKKLTRLQKLQLISQCQKSSPDSDNRSSTVR